MQPQLFFQTDIASDTGRKAYVWVSYSTVFKKQIYKQLQTLTTDDYESLNINISLILPAQINQLRNDSNERKSLCVFAFVYVCEWKLLIKANRERCREEQSNQL